MSFPCWQTLCGARPPDFYSMPKSLATGLNIPGLRFWPLTRFPYLVFYVERDDHIDIWRVLHEQRDIPAWLVTDTDSADQH